MPKILLCIISVLYSVIAANQSNSTVSGYISDKITNEPLAGIRVMVEETGYFTYSNENGHFTVNTVLPSVYTLHISGTGYKSLDFTNNLIKPDSLHYFTIALTQLSYDNKDLKTASYLKKITISGTVIDSTSYSPIAGVPVYLDDGSVSYSDLRGNFSLHTYYRKKMLIGIKTSGYNPWILNAIDTNNIGSITIRLHPNITGGFIEDTTFLAQLYGKIIDSITEGPVAGARLVLDSLYTFYSNQNGEYHITALKTGNHFIEIDSDLHYKFSISFTILGLDTLIRNDFILAPRISHSNGNISGTVYFGDGNPVQSSIVLVDRNNIQTTTDSSGKFLLTGLPDTAVTLIVINDKYQPHIINNISPDTTVSIILSDTVNSGFDTNEFLKNLQSSQTITFSGTVVEQDGEFPVENATVSIAELARKTITSPDGKFKLDSLKQGKYSIIISSEGFDTSHIDSLSLSFDNPEQLQFKLVRTGGLTVQPKKGRLYGSVFLSETGGPLASVRVTIDGTKYETFSDMHGIYRFSGLPEGTYTLIPKLQGYMLKTDTKIQISNGTTKKADLELQKDTIRELQQMYVSATLNKNSSINSLKSRQEKFDVSDGISGEDMSKAGSSSAADAMTKVTGVTVVDGKYVYIRGMGERYVYTSLNNLEVPSPDPDFNAVPLDIFPTGLIDNISINKSFSPDRPGNFSGGNVNILSKSIPDSRKLSLSIKTGANTQVIGSLSFLTYDGGKLDWLGFDDGTRAIPEAVSIKNSIPNYSIAQHNLDTALLLDSQTKSFNDIFNYKKSKGVPDFGLGFTYGDKFNIGENLLGFNASLTYSKSSNLYENGVSSRYRATDNAERSTVLEATHNRTRNESSSDVKWGALGSLTFTDNDNINISSTFMYLQNGDDKTKELFGAVPKIEDKNVLSVSLEYTQRNMNIFQLDGKFSIPHSPVDLLWRGSVSKTSQNQPDLRQYLVTLYGIPGISGYDYQFDGGQPRPRRYYRYLTEKYLQEYADVVFHLDGNKEDRSILKAGFSYQGKHREYRERYFQFESKSSESSINNLDGDIDYYFSDKNAGLLHDSTIITYNRRTRTWDTLYTATLGVCVSEFPLESSNYDSRLKIPSGYSMLNLVFDKFKASAGLRYEHTQSTLEMDSVSGKSGFQIGYSEWLPAVSAMWAWKENLNLRLAFGKTIARPSPRESAPFTSYDIESNGLFYGNPDLKHTRIYNCDLRLEFIQHSDLLAGSFFYKSLSNPIEKVIIDDNNSVQYQNVDHAILAGAELEMRLGLSRLTRKLDGFNLILNGAYIYSRVNLGSEELAMKRAWDKDWPSYRPLQSQSPWVLNFDMTYDYHPWGINAGLFFNVRGARISAVSSKEAPDVYEQPSPSLNGSISKKFQNGLSMKMVFKNIFDPFYQNTYTYKNIDYVYSKYKKGRGVSLDLSYSF